MGLGDAFVYGYCLCAAGMALVNMTLCTNTNTTNVTDIGFHNINDLQNNASIALLMDTKPQSSPSVNQPPIQQLNKFLPL